MKYLILSLIVFSQLSFADDVYKDVDGSQYFILKKRPVNPDYESIMNLQGAEFADAFTKIRCGKVKCSERDKQALRFIYALPGAKAFLVEECPSWWDREEIQGTGRYKETYTPGEMSFIIETQGRQYVDTDDVVKIWYKAEMYCGSGRIHHGHSITWDIKKKKKVSEHFYSMGADCGDFIKFDDDGKEYKHSKLQNCRYQYGKFVKNGKYVN